MIFTMAKWRLLSLIITLAIAVENIRASHQKRETVTNLCEAGYNNTNKVQCFCVIDTEHEKTIKSADCYLTNNDTSNTDSAWNEFENVRIIEKLIFSNPRGASLKYIPTTIFKHVPDILSVTVKYADIKDIKPYAFSNLSHIQEIVLSGNEIEVLHRHAFSHHLQLTTIVLDTNKIAEINRDVFIDLPLLEKLFLTTNKITTLHDKAFIYLVNLKELELDKNKIFSLNSETFTGLRNLRRLELSGNSLEVIGDNTFTPLVNLQSLNLEGNNIQMLDDKAFKGLSNLRLLSLARNKLSGLDNVKLFEGLNSLVSLNLKSNKINYLKSEVIKPILHNFYGTSSSFEFNENEFICDCRLDWFVALSKKTSNSRMKLAIENLQCNPDADLLDKWKKVEENYKSAGAVFDDANGNTNVGDYEYYDESQLNGKLFFVDVIDLLNCSTVKKSATPIAVGTTVGITTISSTPLPVTISQHTTISVSSQSKPHKAKDAVTTPYFTESMTTPRPQSTHAISHGVLKLSDETEKIEKTERQPAIQKYPDVFPVSSDMVRKADQSKNSFTTSRLATVSAKPSGDLTITDDDKMASDEAAHPDLRTGVHQEQKYFQKSGSHINIGTALITIPILTIFLRLI